MVMVVMVMVMMLVVTLGRCCRNLPDLQRWQLPSLCLRDRSCSFVPHFLQIARCIAPLNNRASAWTATEVLYRRANGNIRQDFQNGRKMLS